MLRPMRRMSSGSDICFGWFALQSETCDAAEYEQNKKGEVLVRDFKLLLGTGWATTIHFCNDMYLAFIAPSFKDVVIDWRPYN